MMVKFFWNFGSLILVVLGTVHLILTFCTNKFQPKDAAVAKAMKLTNPILSDSLTMWSGWQGFNASHSAGIIFIGLINLYLMTKHVKLLQSDYTFYLLNIFTVGFYIFLAYKYWFNIPLYGLLITLFCFITSFAIIVLNK